MAENIKAIELLNELLLEMGFTSDIDFKLGDSDAQGKTDVVKFTLGRSPSPPERNYYLLYCSTTNRVTLLTGVFEILEAIWDLKDGKLGKVQRYVDLTDPNSLDVLRCRLEKLRDAHHELEIEAVETLTKHLKGNGGANKFLQNWIESVEDPR
jgi:hypothetical protein